MNKTSLGLVLFAPKIQHFLKILKIKAYQVVKKPRQGFSDI